MRPILPAALVGAVVISAAIHLVAVLVPQLRSVFWTFEMTASQWLVVVALSLSIVPILEVMKLLQRRGVVGSELGPMSRRG
jgi:Ca2+-transporting ATPase